MLVANETVAAFLEANDVPTLYRIHEAPDLLKVEQFEEFITTLGYTLAAPMSTVKPRHFQKLVEKLRGKPEERPIATLMLRTMQKARYDTACLGHFGLAADAYAHFTSPIRRYPDLIVHRTLREFRHGKLSDALYEERVEELPELGAAHVGDGAARGRGRERARRVEEGAVHGRQGRRGVRRLHHRRRPVRPVRAAGGALRRGPRPHLEPGRRLLPLPRTRAPAARREHAPRLPSRRSHPRAGDSRRSGSPAGGSRRRRSARSHPRVGAQSRAAHAARPVHAARPPRARDGRASANARSRRPTRGRK